MIHIYRWMIPIGLAILMVTTIGVITNTQQTYAQTTDNRAVDNWCDADGLWGDGRCDAAPSEAERDWLWVTGWYLGQYYSGNLTCPEIPRYVQLMVGCIGGGDGTSGGAQVAGAQIVATPCGWVVVFTTNQAASAPTTFDQGFAGNMFTVAADSIAPDVTVDHCIHGNTNNNSIEGGIGDDQVFGYDGADSLYGSTGSDTLDGGADSDWVFGGWNNSPTGANRDDIGSDLVQDTGNSDTDVLWGGNNNYRATVGSPPMGNDGSDVIYDNGGNNDFLSGGNQNQSGGVGNDGNDTLTDDGGNNDVIRGGNGNNTGGDGDDGDDSITDNGGTGDLIVGGNFNRTAGSGNDGQDTINAVDGAGSDTIYGGNQNPFGGTGTDPATDVINADGDASAACNGTGDPDDVCNQDNEN